MKISLRNIITVTLMVAVGSFALKQIARVSGVGAGVTPYLP